MYISLNYIHKILENVDTDLLHLLSFNETNKNEFNEFYNKCKSIFNINSLYKRDINIFNEGYNTNIDEKNAIYKKQIVIMEELCKKFSEMIKKEDKKIYEDNSLLVEYEWSERDRKL